MMSNPELAGESSCKRQENGDASAGPERPLKKARFAWQVKGKYHLKNDTQESSSSTHMDSEKSQGSIKNESNLGNTEQNLEILGDYLLKQDFNTLDSVIADSDKSLLKPATNLSAEKLEYPRYVSSFESSGSRMSCTSRNDHRSMVPMSVIATRNYNEDQCIARWQARQMAKGFVDNTINRVLDSWMIAPLPGGMDNNQFLALDVAEFINNLPGDNSIENEGILMAISAHGLQNNSGSSSNDDSNSEEQIVSSSSTKDDIFPSRSSSPIQSDEEKFKSTNDKKSVEESYSFSDLHMAWSYDNESDVNNSHPQFSLFPETNSSCFENNHHQNSNIEFEDGNANGNDILTSHYDFMDAAVSFAIQNKGLTSFGTDYG